MSKKANKQETYLTFWCEFCGIAELLKNTRTYQGLSQSRTLPIKDPKKSRPMATRTKKTKTTKTPKTRSNPEGKPTQDTLQGFFKQSTPKGYGYQDNIISDDFALPPPQVPRQQTGNGSVYAESETRGSHHPSHLQEFGNQDDDPNDPDWQPDNYSNIRQRIEDWRTPQVSQVYQE